MYYDYIHEKEINRKNFTKRGGRIIKCVLTCILLIGIVANDLHNYKVNNKLILVGTVAGVIVSIWNHGAYGLWQFALGYMTPILILYLFFILKMFGAGDIKTFAVIGGLYGIPFVLSCIVYSLFAGGIICILSMLKSKNLILAYLRLQNRFNHFFQYVSSCVVNKKIGAYDVAQAKKEGATIHFTIAIFIGFLVTILVSYQ